MFKLNTISAAALVCLGLAVTASATAQETLERVTVTGSNIKRISAEGPLPVEVITRADIERKGVATTNELLRSLSYMSSFNDELQSNSPNATGSATAGFRGLSGDQTVVLLNGRRLANYGFDGAFVNLNTIPLGAIQRVEVLKDGAAAIYGADAIGGVINFITRRDYRGAEMSASYGVTSKGDSDETSVTGTVGHGQLDSDGYNVLVNLNYFKREPLMNLDRERTRTGDYSRFGGSNQLSTYAPTGNFVNPTTGLQSPFTPCPDPSLIVTPSPLSGSGSSCVFDFTPYRTTLYGAERWGGLISGRANLGSNAQAFAEVMFSRSESFASAAGAPGIFTLPVGHPANSFNTAISVRGRPLQAGPRTTDNTSDASRVLVGIEGTFGKYDYNVAVGQAKNKTTNVDGGYFLLDKMFAAIANRTFDPFSLKNPQSVVDAIKSSDTRVGETTNTFIDAKVSTEVGQLSGGAIGLAAGVTFGKEEISDVPGANARIGNIFGGIQQSQVVADRTLSAAYAEMSLPFTKSIEAQLALRHDRYEGGISSTTPKVAVRFQPVKEVLLRASYSEGFKMPSLRDQFGGQNQSADSVQDTPGCTARKQTTCPRLQYDRFSSGNPALKPEKAKGMNFGVQLEPTANTRLGLDYFMIDKTDEIGLVLTQYVIDSVPYVTGATTTLGGNSLYSVTRNAGGTITAVNTSNGNLGQRKIRGFDVSAEQRILTSIGRFTLEASGTYYSKYTYADMPGTPMYNRLALLNLPRWRTQARLGFQTGNWDSSLVFNSRADMYDKPQSQAATPVTAATAVVGNFDTFDFSLVYTGFKGLRLSGSVRNLLNKEPPFSNNDPRTLGFSQMDDIRGRYFTVSANYSF
ncbi:TonB-dependent receptor [Roseateles sp. DAIF2]|uniref:TonB-dependent receptor n=1 Tax=Roseateles sp. DAIF2 TaxID=2714952 RepID=UPI0018A2BAA2|nr:TonB-dependent receptor [Roseateles sp. DAIF2]QPF76003.1 TonB-dependent receptor [Roseateles sp. DAIF2]